VTERPRLPEEQRLLIPWRITRTEARTLHRGKEQSAQKEHTVAWDLNGAQSAHPMILTVDVSTEAESPSVQFNPMNMPQVKKYPPVIHHRPDTAFFNTLRKSPKKNPRGKEENR
jgi:hypothetical protein